MPWISTADRDELIARIARLEGERDVALKLNEARTVEVNALITRIGSLETNIALQIANGFNGVQTEALERAFSRLMDLTLGEENRSLWQKIFGQGEGLLPAINTAVGRVNENVAGLPTKANLKDVEEALREIAGQMVTFNSRH